MFYNGVLSFVRYFFRPLEILVHTKTLTDEITCMKSASNNPVRGGSDEWGNMPWIDNY